VENDPVAAALSAVGVPVVFRTFPEGTDTAEQAAAAVGCDLAAIVKSLLFMAGDEMVLALVSGADRLDEAKLAAEIDSEMLSVRKATAREVEDQTGFKIGTVPPLGHRKPMRVYLDRELMIQRVVWVASGVRHRVFPISPVMLAAAAGATIAEIRAEA
jgi:prolyl-tRNA editing enzyme YbaK/EbsC (Cys-tRNA(Pro) deacylase)